MDSPDINLDNLPKSVLSDMCSGLQIEVELLRFIVDKYDHDTNGTKRPKETPERKALVNAYQKPNGELIKLLKYCQERFSVTEKTTPWHTPRDSETA